jgi:hypothetical protein
VDLQAEYDVWGKRLKAALATGDERSIERAEGKLADIMNSARKQGVTLKDVRETIPSEEEHAASEGVVNGSPQKPARRDV